MEKEENKYFSKKSSSLVNAIVKIINNKEGEKEEKEEKTQSAKNTGKKMPNIFSKLFSAFSLFNAQKADLIIYDLRKAECPDGKAILRKRSKEIREIFSIIGKRKFRNVIIYGEDGSGRHQLIEGIVTSIKLGICPERFKKSLFLEIPSEQFSTEVNDVSTITSRINWLYQIAHHYPNTIIFFSNISKLTSYGLIDAMQLIFDNAICIGIMSEEELEEDDIKNYFSLYCADIPKKEDLYSLLKGNIKEIEKFHNVTISHNAFNKIVDETVVATYVTKIGDILDVADQSASIAENHGLKKVDIKSILETDRYNIDVMLNRPEKLNNFYATHEAGHAIIALHYNVGIEAISIIPKDNGQTGGFNLFEIDNNSLDSKEDTLRRIEIGLGGYAGTLFRGYPLTYGASGDLLQVSKTARAMYLYLGLEENKPISYLNELGQLELNYMSDKMTYDLSLKVEKVIDNSLKKVESIIKENEKKFALLTSAIEKKGFLTKKTNY